MLIHPLAGVLSAYGMGLADVTAMRERAVEAPLADADCRELARRRSTHSAPTPGAELQDEGVPAERITAVRRAHLRYDGTDTAVAGAWRQVGRDGRRSSRRPTGGGSPS